MQFYYAGENWDTDKPVYILGHYVINWFPISSQEMPKFNDSQLTCKKVYIKTIEIAHEGPRSWVNRFTTTFPAGTFYTISSDECIIGKSPKQAKEKYKSLLKGEKP